MSWCRGVSDRTTCSIAAGTKGLAAMTAFDASGLKTSGCSTEYASNVSPSTHMKLNASTSRESHMIGAFSTRVPRKRRGGHARFSAKIKPAALLLFGALDRRYCGP
eukprot:CAMPEP_0206829554 /NCGR_PEP_ID=MMETSP0975-20121206/16424_1 /ASSEMBLY_ACC=CAM_ASM_000399 /TAXON_ID=483370 /ORGANISM="non described non described, Strain CCMP2097" /LENGTH=105 /DNA_ID=CAMNT_0054371893 /DNA_START=205 /DNA_END=522 /DNA_ORIENTATION=+